MCHFLKYTAGSEIKKGLFCKWMFYLVFRDCDTLQKPFLLSADFLTTDLRNMFFLPETSRWGVAHWFTNWLNGCCRGDRRNQSSSCYLFLFKNNNMAPWNAGKPPEDQKTHQPTLTHSSYWGEGCVLYFCYWLLSFNQRHSAPIQCCLDWETPSPAPPLDSVSEVFITTTSHIPFKVTQSLRERD